MQNKGADTLIRSFEEVYKTSYSHGLESIYRIENVDLKSVRKLGGESASTSNENLLDPKFIPLPLEIAEGLDFGPTFNEYVTSFVVQEPIQMLKLSKHTEKCLLEQGLKTIGDLRASDLLKLVFVKGIGQGHVEEIKGCLSKYIHEKPIDKAYLIDFSSWIRSAVGSLEPKLAFVLLESWGLSKLIPMSPLESLEVKKMTLERKKEMLEKAFRQVLDPEKVKQVAERFEEIEKVFLLPWMEERGGLATKEEIYERLERVSEEYNQGPESTLLVKACLQFLSEHFMSQVRTQEFPFNLREEEGIYFSSKAKLGLFYDLEERILSYLWTQDTKVSLEDLNRWIALDLLSYWEPLDVNFLKKVLSYSKKIIRQKNQDTFFIKRRSLYVNL